MTDAVAVDNKKSSSSSNLFTQISGKRKAADKFATVIIYLAMILALIPLLWVLFKVLSEGLPAILSPDWWMYDMVGQPRNKAGGGAIHALSLIHI